jgi:hypothetical protein
MPVATHTPVIIEPGAGAGTSLVGATLLGHVAPGEPAAVKVGWGDPS